MMILFFGNIADSVESLDSLLKVFAFDLSC